MEQQKRLNKTDFVIVYLLIFSLVTFVAGFFLGASTIKSKLSQEFEKYQEQRLKEEQVEKLAQTYPPTDFVSFYHAVYLPYEKFRATHYIYLKNTTQKLNKTDKISMDLDMKSLAEETLSELKKTENFKFSPELQKSKEMYIQSLEAYIDGIASLFHEQDNIEQAGKGNAILVQKEGPAQRYWLAAQVHFYQAIHEWDSIYNGQQITVSELNQVQSLDEWNQLNFHQKNYVIAETLESLSLSVPYNPEDIHIHLFSAIQSGNGAMLGDLKQAIRLLYVTNAVKKGDFLQEKNAYYPNIKSPLLPLFSN